jgi:hypothetical protein
MTIKIEADIESTESSYYFRALLMHNYGPPKPSARLPRFGVSQWRIFGGCISSKRQQRGSDAKRTLGQRTRNS